MAMTAIPAWMMMASAAATAASAVMQGVSASNTAKYNSAMANRQADETRAAGQIEEQRQRLRAQSVLSAQRARIAASGVDLEGSPLLAMEESAANAEFDALTIRHAATSQEVKLRAQAANERRQGNSALFGGFLGAGASLLGGASKMQSLYGPSTPAAPAGMYNGGTGTNPTTGLRFGGV